jgi:tRNA threonylcarbamoyl adenosine modification protein YeaZ
VPLLSFDTSSRSLSVAIVENGRVLAEANLESEANAKADRQESVSLLLPTIDSLTRQLGLKKEDFGAIAVGIGPGGFTGVRVAVVTGRTLAQALKLPLVGINSLEVASYGAPSAEGCGVIREASKTHCFVARYQRSAFDGDLYDLKELRAPQYISFENFARQLSHDEEGHFHADPLVVSRFEQFSQRVKAALPVNNVAACQAKIAHVRLSLKAVEGEDLLTNFPYRLVQPLYLRGASVTLKKGDVIERVETH